MKTKGISKKVEDKDKDGLRKGISKKVEDKKKIGGMTVMLVNCRSVCNKIEKFRTLLEVHRPELVVAVETWLDDGYSENELSVDGYVLHRRDRNKHGGGIMVAVKNGVRGTVMWIDEETEMMGMKISVGLESFHFIAVYRPPNGGEELLNRLEQRVTELSRVERVVIAGDLNLPHVRWAAGGNGGGTTQNIITSIMNEGFTQVVREGTRITTSGGNNTLDVMLVKPEEIWSKTTVVDGISDHRVPIVSLILESGNEVKLDKTVWYYKKAVAGNIRKAFEETFEPWNNFVRKDNIDEIWISFRKLCDDIRQEYVPSKVVTENSDPPFYDKNVKRLKRKCRKLHNNRKNGCDVEDLKLIRKELNKAKSKAKERFMEKMFDESDMQGSWNRMYRYIGGQKGHGRNIPTLLDDEGNEWDNDVDKATALNSQYAKVFSKNEKIGYVREGPPEKERKETLISSSEVWRVLRKLQNSKSPGVDGLSNDFIKLAGKFIVPYLVTIFNVSLKLGKVPREWKEAIVAPIFKGGGRGKVSNYRPISLTSLVCKIMERVIHNRIKDIVEDRGGISDNQHGFRKGFSCETQLLGFVEDLSEVMDNGGRVDAVFLDFEKAFDKVDHYLLMEKLWNAIENLEIVNWVGDFLRNRVQRVRVGGVVSENTEVTSGVPQGSVLGPLLFDIFIEDISSVVKSKIRLFADDCVLYNEVRYSEDKESMQEDLCDLDKWVQTNKMGLNVSKCKVISFCRSRSNDVHEYSVGGDKLENVDSYKYLGVIFRKDLGWGEQVSRVSKKGINSLNFVMRQLKGASNSIKEKAYLSLVRPIVEYASSVWDPYRAGEVKDVEKVQRLAARRVTGRIRRWRYIQNCKGELERELDSPSEMINELGWETLATRRKNDRLCNYFRVMEGNDGWRELNGKTKVDSALRGCRGAHKRKVVVLGSKKDVGKYSFLNRTGRDWNSVDARVFDGSDINVYKFRKNIRDLQGQSI